jgi:Tfp pilus assembly protein PilV
MPRVSNMGKQVGAALQPARRSKATELSGSTLVEVMVALLILAVMALGTAAFMYHGRSSVYAQRDRLAVFELANGRLEELRAEPYTTFTDTLPETYDVYWMRKRAGAWEFYNVRRTQNLLVNRSRRYRITTTVQYVDADGGTPSYDMLQFTVSMRYRTGDTDEVILSTYRAP